MTRPHTNAVEPIWNLAMSFMYECLLSQSFPRRSEESIPVNSQPFSLKPQPLQGALAHQKVRAP